MPSLRFQDLCARIEPVDGDVVVWIGKTSAGLPRQRRLHGVAERGIKTTVIDALIAGDRGAIAIRCEYPQGGVVRENALIELRDGKIARWEGVQAWDQ